MSTLALFLIVVVVAIMLAFGAPREKFIEYLKELSDRLLLWFLWRTSQFGSELTRDGKWEQRQWREQRLRNLKGLAIRSKQRSGGEQN